MGIGPGAAERKLPGGWCQDRIIDLILKVSGNGSSGPQNDGESGLLECQVRVYSNLTSF